MVNATLTAMTVVAIALLVTAVAQTNPNYAVGAWFVVFLTILCHQETQR